MLPGLATPRRAEGQHGPRPARRVGVLPRQEWRDGVRLEGHRPVSPSTELESVCRSLTALPSTAAPTSLASDCQTQRSWPTCLPSEPASTSTFRTISKVSSLCLPSDDLYLFMQKAKYELTRVPRRSTPLHAGEYMDQKELKPPGGTGPTPLAQEWRKKYSIDNVRPGVEAVSRPFVLASESCLFAFTGVFGRTVLRGDRGLHS